MKKIALLLLSLFFGISAHAQDSSVEMADLMRSNGKIYVVVGVMMLIVIGFLIYLIRVDLKLKQLEKELNSK